MVKGWLNPKDNGAIRDSIPRASASHFLAPLSAVRYEIERDEVSEQTRLKCKGRALVWKMKPDSRRSLINLLGMS